MADKNDCFSCKVVSMSCLFGVGFYFFKLGLNSKPKYVYQLIGTGLVGLGIGEIFDVSPFRSRIQ